MKLCFIERKEMNFRRWNPTEAYDMMSTYPRFCVGIDFFFLACRQCHFPTTTSHWNHIFPAM